MLISIIIPALNEAATIGVTLASTRSARDVEVIVVDGGRTKDDLRERQLQKKAH